MSATTATSSSAAMVTPSWTGRKWMTVLPFAHSVHPVERAPEAAHIP